MNTAVSTLDFRSLFVRKRVPLVVVLAILVVALISLWQFLQSQWVFHRGNASEVLRGTAEAFMRRMQGFAIPDSARPEKQSTAFSPPLEWTRATGEQRTRMALERLSGLPFPSARPLWLRNPATGHLLQLDMYNAAHGLAVEYDGAQHHHFTPGFHRTWEAFEMQQIRDRTKEQLCQQHGVVLMRVPYTIQDGGPASLEQYLRDYIMPTVQQRSGTTNETLAGIPLPSPTMTF